MKTILFIIITAALCSAATVYLGTMQQGDVIPFYGVWFDQLRMQALINSSQLGMSGSISQIAFRVQLDDPGGTPGTYDNAHVRLCHTDLIELTNNFTTNYNGYSPITTLSGVQLVVPGIQNSWVVMDFALPFAYSNAHNLIFELEWDGDNNETVPVWAFSPGMNNRRLYSDVIGAETGTLGSLSYYLRFIISGTAVEPNSLGKIKGMFTHY